MPFLFLGLIVLAVLLLCVLGMSVGVLSGRKPIKHCGAVVDASGNKVECSICGNTSCKNKKELEEKKQEA
ncbi:MAG: ApbE family protein [Verrucomicrobia bacterium]|nr:ApbE family protein [Verrucomicrobiota bacterium]MCH8512603.1 ApbE family protein [Kiritimatiellia bacterium]